MENQALLLRKEYFGGTLFNATSGKRIYININEFYQTKKDGIISEDLRFELGTTINKVIIKEPAFLPKENFSAPDTAFFELTRSCNLNCKHCFNKSGKKSSQELSIEQKKMVLDDFCLSGLQEIRFTGGEPLMSSSLFEFILEIRKRGLRASIGTNGTLINFHTAKKLAVSGLNVAIISIDGMREKHDLIRGKGNFQKTIDGIQNLLDVGIEVRINMVAMKSNLSEIPLTVEYFFKKNIPVMIRRFIPAGRAVSMRTEALSSGEYKILREKLKKFIEDPRGIVRGHYLKDDEPITRMRLPFKRSSCSAGQRGIVVLPDGNIQMCGFLGPLGECSVGNVSKIGLFQIWKKIIISKRASVLRPLVDKYNFSTIGPQTNCLAIALAFQKGA